MQYHNFLNNLHDMNTITIKRPWSTIVVTILMTFVFSLVVTIFTDNDQQLFTTSFVMALTLAIYNDYVRPAWRAHARSRILGVVSDKKNASLETKDVSSAAKKSERTTANLLTPIPERSDGIFSQLKPIDPSCFAQILTSRGHRFDRLRQYRTNMRYLVSIMIIVLMALYLIERFVYVDNYQAPYVGIFFTLCVLLEYNISLFAGKHVPGVFFRDHSGSESDTQSVSAGLDGEEKVSFLMMRNPLAIGTGIFGRPLLGIFVCWLWLLAISSWVVWIICIGSAIVCMKFFRRKLESADGPFTLLRLRVFDTPSYGKFLELLEGWQYIGTQYSLDGPDTSGYSFNSRFKVLLGKVDDLVIKTDAELEPALVNVSNTYDKFERFDTKAIQCNDLTWVKGLEKFIVKSDIVVMLLTDFNAENNGCVTELKILMDTTPMSKVILLVNSETDLPYLKNVLDHTWHERSQDSANDNISEGPYVFDLDALYDFKPENVRSGVKIKMQLIDFLYNKVKE